jgi:adenylate cyclase
MNRFLGTRLRLLAISTLVGIAAGLVYMPFIWDPVTPDAALRFAAQGLLIVLPVAAMEIFVWRGALDERLRRARFAIVLAVRTVVTTAIILAAYGVGALLLFPERFTEGDILGGLARDTVFALAVSLTLQIALMLRSIIGGRVLLNLLLGRYHRPLSERRIFLFLDLAGSTALAERVGPVGAYRLVSRFFFDVAQETQRFGGETDGYIGDAVVVTWPMLGGAADARCLECCFAIRDRIAARAESYRRDFGLVPSFRAGLHGGAVVAGECGDDKREIVYFGDAVNTAARIEQACRTHGREILASGPLLRDLALPPGLTSVSLGTAALRGRASEIELFAIERR